MELYRDVEINCHRFLTSMLDGGECSTSCSSHLTSRERSTLPYILDRRLGGPIADLAVVAKRKIPASA